MTQTTTETVNTQQEAQTLSERLEAIKASATQATEAAKETAGKVGTPMIELAELAQYALTTDEAKAFYQKAWEVLGALAWAVVHVVLLVLAYAGVLLGHGVIKARETYQGYQSVYLAPGEQVDPDTEARALGILEALGGESVEAQEAMFWADSEEVEGEKELEAIRAPKVDPLGGHQNLDFTYRPLRQG